MCECVCVCSFVCVGVFVLMFVVSTCVCSVYACVCVCVYVCDVYVRACTITYHWTRCGGVEIWHHRGPWQSPSLSGVNLLSSLLSLSSL